MIHHRPLRFLPTTPESRFLRSILILLLLWSVSQSTSAHQTTRETDTKSDSKPTPNILREVRDQTSQSTRPSTDREKPVIISPLPAVSEDHPYRKTFTRGGKSPENDRCQSNSRSKSPVQRTMVDSYLMKLLGRIQGAERRMMIADEIFAEIERRRNDAEILLERTRPETRSPHPEDGRSAQETAGEVNLQTRDPALLSGFRKLSSARTSLRRHQLTSRSQLRTSVEHYIRTCRMLRVLTDDLTKACPQGKVRSIAGHLNGGEDRCENLATNLLTTVGRQMELMRSTHLHRVRIATDLHRTRRILTRLQQQAQETDRSRTSTASRMPTSGERWLLGHCSHRTLRQLRSQRLRLEMLSGKMVELVALIHNHPQVFAADQIYLLRLHAINQRSTINVLLFSCEIQLVRFSRLLVLVNSLHRNLKEIRRTIHFHHLLTADAEPLTWILSVKDLRESLRELICSCAEIRSADRRRDLVDSHGSMTLIPGLILALSLPVIGDTHLRSAEKDLTEPITISRTDTSSTSSNLPSSTAAPSLLLWISVGYVLTKLRYSILLCLGQGMLEITPALGIFASHLHPLPSRRSSSPQSRWMEWIACGPGRYRILIVCTATLTAITIALGKHHGGKFRPSIGRFCFLFLCLLLTSVLTRAKRANLHTTTRVIRIGDLPDRFAKILSISAIYAAWITSCMGYLYTAELVLTRLWLLITAELMSSIFHHTVRIQTSARHRHRSLKIGEKSHISSSPHAKQGQQDRFVHETGGTKLDRKEIQSLKLTRTFLTSGIMLVAFLSCPEVDLIFKFLEDVILWEIRDGEHVRLITINSVFLTFLLIILTTQTVRNMPILLERLVLDNISLDPGTGYTVVNLTRYGVMLLSAAISFSAIGVEWIKLQWLIAALGVGLGFGLQEIFTNFISGLIILFEKPVRVGDTVTIGNLTGSVTKINTRATTITDWNHREIIVPNKAFITDRFVNWSLSDTVTRIVLNIPAPSGANTRQVATILVQSALRCSLVLRMPIPEALLIDLSEGLPIFELRMYAAEIRHRVSIKHQVCTLILEGYREYGMELPFPPMHIRNEQVSAKSKTTRAR